MKKVIIIAAAVAILGGSAFAYTAYAQNHHPGRHQLSATDMSAFADARIAALRAGLVLSNDQQKFWPPVETALKDMSKKRIDTREKMRAEIQARRESGTRLDPVERMRRGADRMSERAGDLKKLADATQPLYASLDEGQKRRFDMLSRAGMRNHMQQERHHWRRHGQHEEQHMRGHRGGEGRGHMGQRNERTGWDSEDSEQDTDRI